MQAPCDFIDVDRTPHTLASPREDDACSGSATQVHVQRRPARNSNSQKTYSSGAPHGATWHSHAALSALPLGGAPTKQGFFAIGAHGPYARSAGKCAWALRRTGTGTTTQVTWSRRGRGCSASESGAPRDKWASPSGGAPSSAEKIGFRGGAAAPLCQADCPSWHQRAGPAYLPLPTSLHRPVCTAGPPNTAAAPDDQPDNGASTR